ncbi:MAG: HIT family protein [Deltaproteobacteria bacterium]|nr:HIT family protein [Deltaproteobacteria bacterium]
MSDCVFCDIVEGSSSASIVFQDEICIVLMDTEARNPGHMLVVPKEHSASLSELEPDIGAHLFKVAQHMARAVRLSNVRCEGVNLFLADGRVAGQEVFHVHLHVLPRFDGDGFGFKGGKSEPRREELDAIAKDISDRV